MEEELGNKGLLERGFRGESECPETSRRREDGAPLFQEGWGFVKWLSVFFHSGEVWLNFFPFLKWETKHRVLALCHRLVC